MQGLCYCFLKQHQLLTYGKSHRIIISTSLLAESGSKEVSKVEDQAVSWFTVI